MIEFLLYIAIFSLLYSLHTKVTNLEKEIFYLKRSASKKKLGLMGTVTLKTPVEKPQASLARRVKQKKVEHSSPAKNQIQNPLFEYLKNYFNTGNIVVKIGGVILFFGLAFLAKYASERSLISIEVRLLALVLFSFVLTGFGWKLRMREGYYGLVLQGLGIGVFYLVVFVSTKLYTLLPPSLAFIVMLSIVIFGSLLAIVQNALPLAIFAIGGGFLAPILTSDGSGSHITLFSYYALLNSAIVGIAWYRSWRVLNLMGFIFTFVIATFWGVLTYKPEFLWTTEPFLILFFFFYIFVSILFTYKQSFNARGMVDASIVFGLPLIVFSLQVSLVHQFEYALAVIAISMGFFYLFLYKVLSRYKNMQLLGSSFFYLSIIFFTISIPYIFDAQITSALWVLESSAIIYISLKQNRFISRIAGEILQIFSTIIYILSSLSHNDLYPFVNSFYLGYIIIFTASLFTAYSLYKNQDKLSSFDKKAPLAFLIIAVLLLLFSGAKESLNIDIPRGNTMLAYLALCGFSLSLVASKLKWTPLINILQGYLTLGILLFVSLLSYYKVSHPFGEFGFVSIILFFAVHYFLLYVYEKEWKNKEYLHIASLWMISLLGAKELSYIISTFTYNSIYADISWGVFFILMLSMLLKIERLLPRFFSKYMRSYQIEGTIGIMVMLSVWEFYSISLAGELAPLPYISFLNPLELIELLGLFLIYNYFKNSPKIYVFVGPIILVFLTLVLARSVHAYFEVDYTITSLSKSMIFQMSLSILWTLIAMLVMVRASSKEHRTLWIGGASLIGVVVVKLFVVELANSGSVERIISFIAVGILLLLIGYFSPLPPVKKALLVK